jgi:YidC/Oxa1 family membrane protein insertase
VQHLFDVFLPIDTVWWAVFGLTMAWALNHIYAAFLGNAVLSAIGAYGSAIVALTLLAMLILAPLFQIQLLLSKRALEGTRRVAPQIAEVRKKYKSDPQKQQAEIMKVYKDNGVNPLANLSGCLPTLVQLPIWTALYYVLRGNAQAQVVKSAHFLFIPNLNLDPFHQFWSGSGLILPGLVYLIIPVLAAASTYVQTKMTSAMQVPSPSATDQEQQMQAMQKQMMIFMPVMFLYFSAIVPAGLGLYWFVSNLFAILQQYSVMRWGGLPGLHLIRYTPATAPAGGAAGLAPLSRPTASRRIEHPTPAARRTAYVRPWRRDRGTGTEAQSTASRLHRPPELPRSGRREPRSEGRSRDENSRGPREDLGRGGGCRAHPAGPEPPQRRCQGGQRDHGGDGGRGDGSRRQGCGRRRRGQDAGQRRERDGS